MRWQYRTPRRRSRVAFAREGRIAYAPAAASTGRYPSGGFAGCPAFVSRPLRRRPDYKGQPSMVAGSDIVILFVVPRPRNSDRGGIKRSAPGPAWPGFKDRGNQTLCSRNRQGASRSGELVAMWFGRRRERRAPKIFLFAALRLKLRWTIRRSFRQFVFLRLCGRRATRETGARS